MQTEIKLTKTELKKISLEFRIVAGRLIKTEWSQGISNLKRFIGFINENQIINDFICENNKHGFEDINLFQGGRYQIPDDNKSKEISYVYQILKQGLNKYEQHRDGGYLEIAGRYCMVNFEQMVSKFNKNVVLPFVDHIRIYLENIQIDMGDDEQTKISITNINQSNSSIGVGVNQSSKIITEKLAGTINEASQKNIAEVAAEIQQLLEQLSETNPTSTATEKSIVVTEATEKIEKNPILKSKVVNALKAGGAETLKEAIDHPLVNILLATIEGWKAE